MSLDSFSFRNPVKVLFGKDSVEKLGPVIKGDGISSLLILFGSGSSKTNGVYDRVQKVLKENGINSVEVWGVQPNPLISKVREAVAFGSKYHGLFIFFFFYIFFIVFIFFKVILGISLLRRKQFQKKDYLYIQFLLYLQLHRNLMLVLFFQILSLN
jgi:hypothetical protein